MILSFDNSGEHVFQKILRIVRDQPDFQIRDMILNDEILDFGGLKINPLKRNVEKKGNTIDTV